MKKLIAVAVLSAAMVPLANARIVEAFSGGLGGSTGEFSDGSDWTSDVVFNVGTFADLDAAPSYDAGSQMVDGEWNWTTVQFDGEDAAHPGNQWQGSFFSFNVSYDETPPETQGFIWGHNVADPGAGTEWIVLTDPNWIFQSADPAIPSVLEFHVGPDTETHGGFGTVAFDDEASFSSVEVVPEPSTYALIFGLGVLALVGYRRFRS